MQNPDSPHLMQVHGIMIYYPCFGLAPSFYGGSMDDYLRDSVPIEKDVEGLCDTVSIFSPYPRFHYLRPIKFYTRLTPAQYRRNLYRNVRFIDSYTQEFKGGIQKKADNEGTKKCLLPCTPLAIVKILEHRESRAHIPA